MIVIKTAITVSIVETIGLAKPAEVAVEANRVALDVLAIAVADPPPAIMANDQVTTGFKSIVVETTMAVPAMALKEWLWYPISYPRMECSRQIFQTMWPHQR